MGRHEVADVDREAVRPQLRQVVQRGGADGLVPQLVRLVLHGEVALRPEIGLEHHAGLGHDRVAGELDERDDERRHQQHDDGREVDVRVEHGQILEGGGVMKLSTNQQSRCARAPAGC